MSTVITMIVGDSVDPSQTDDGKVLWKVVGFPAPLQSPDFNLFIAQHPSDYYVITRSMLGISTESALHMLKEFRKYPQVGVVYSDTDKTYRRPFDPMRGNVMDVEKAFMISAGAIQNIDFGHTDHFIMQLATRCIISHIAEQLTIEA